MIDLEARARALNEHSASEAAPVEVVLARARRYRTRRRIAASALAVCAAVGGFAVVALVSVGGRGEVRTVNSTASTLRQLSPKKDADLLAVELLGRVVLPARAAPYSGTAAGRGSPSQECMRRSLGLFRFRVKLRSSTLVITSHQG